MAKMAKSGIFEFSQKFDKFCTFDQQKMAFLVAKSFGA